MAGPEQWRDRSVGNGGLWDMVCGGTEQLVFRGTLRLGQRHLSTCSRRCNLRNQSMPEESTQTLSHMWGSQMLFPTSWGPPVPSPTSAPRHVSAHMDLGWGGAG